MKFFIRSKRLVLDCFTTQHSVHEFSAPVRATKLFPKWWRQLPLPSKTYRFDEPYDNTNMRGCSGFVDMYLRSVALPMWCDVDLWVDAAGGLDYGYQFADRRSTAEPLDPAHAAGFFDPYATQHLKFVSPWRVRTNEDVQWAMIPATYNHGVGVYQLLPAVVNFRNDHSTHLQVMVHRQQERQYVHIAHGTPMYLYAPLSEREVDVRTHLVSAAEYERLAPASLTRSYRGRVMAKLRREAGSATGCPFNN